MTQGEAPYGTFATIGHPANQSYIVKTSFGRWRRVETGELVDDENFRAGWDVVYLPGGPAVPDLCPKCGLSRPWACIECGETLP